MNTIALFAMIVMSAFWVYWMLFWPEDLRNAITFRDTRGPFDIAMRCVVCLFGVGFVLMLAAAFVKVLEYLHR